MIAKLFKERSKRFNTRCAKYSRYVFNDHFILVLLFLLGFVLVQYSQLLKHFPKNVKVVKSVGYGLNELLMKKINFTGCHL